MKKKTEVFLAECEQNFTFSVKYILRWTDDYEYWLILEQYFCFLCFHAEKKSDIFSWKLQQAK